MNKPIVVIIVLLIITKVYSQPMNKHWDKIYGGSKGDAVYSISKTVDDGYIMGGTSNSNISGNKTQNSWNNSWDSWVVKVDKEGNKEWDKRYGGMGDDGINSIIATRDSGYVFAGYTSSGVGGDKTSALKGGSDYWVVKIDKYGNIEWDRTYGGTGNELMYGEVIQTLDGGYLIGGQSSSGIGGDKSEPVRGGSSLYHDYWVVKIDSLGNKQWDKTYGGDNQESLTSLLETSDGGYLIGGYSKSGISGDKTEENIGGFDWWVLKVDSTGNIEWDRTYGTINSDGIYGICKTYDGNYILGGGRYIKIDDNGGEFWTKSFIVCAGTNDIQLTSDKGFLISGTARNICSAPTPDQTETNLGDRQTWFVKTDSLFNKQWDKTVFSIGEDYEGKAIEAGNGCYIVVSQSDSDIGGYKSNPGWGGSDYWLVKLCEEPNFIPTLTTEEGVSVMVYPNPFVNEVAIRLQKEPIQEATYVLTTMDGKILYQQHETQLAAGYTKIWDLGTLPSGVYIITVNIAGENIVKRVVKE